MHTYHTAFAFLAASWMTPGSWLQPWLSALACSSVLVHAGYAAVPEGHHKEDAISGWHAAVFIDKALAHVMFVRTICVAVRILLFQPLSVTTQFALAVYAVCLVHVGVIYVWKIRHIEYVQHNLHATMHLTGALGCVALYWAHDGLVRPSCT